MSQEDKSQTPEEEVKVTYFYECTEAVADEIVDLDYLKEQLPPGYPVQIAFVMALGDIVQKVMTTLDAKGCNPEGYHVEVRLSTLHKTPDKEKGYAIVPPNPFKAREN